MVNKKDNIFKEGKVSLLERFSHASLLKRSISAIILLCICWLVFVSGPIAFLFFILLIGLVMLYEWSVTVFRSKTDIIKSTEKYKWYLFGVLYCGISVWSLLVIYIYEALISICVVVWATDIGAYIFGISLGGKKICPKISPSKTWSGLVGGVIFAVVIYEIVNVYYHSYGIRMHEMTFINRAIVVGMTAVFSQIGDFFESYFKRRFRIKDSSNLIPGHGGVLDRVDGLVGASIIWCALSIVSLLIVNFYK